MASYIIIGGDQKEYGPVSAEDVRQWIAEGRLEEKSLVKVQGEAGFRPLQDFPEFADAFAGETAVPPVRSNITEDGAHAAALQKIKVPALGLKITAILNLILSVWSLIALIFFPPDLHNLDSELQQLNNPQLTDFVQKMMHVSSGPFGIVNALLGLAMSVLIFIGASKMQSLRSYEFSLTAAVLSVIPCLTPCCGFVIGIVFGVWALTLLRKPEIKSQFR
jgi:hypothetical protein